MTDRLADLRRRVAGYTPDLADAAAIVADALEQLAADLAAIRRMPPGDGREALIRAVHLELDALRGLAGTVAEVAAQQRRR